MRVAQGTRSTNTSCNIIMVLAAGVLPPHEARTVWWRVSFTRPNAYCMLREMHTYKPRTVCMLRVVCDEETTVYTGGAMLRFRGQARCSCFGSILKNTRVQKVKTKTCRGALAQLRCAGCCRSARATTGKQAGVCVL